MIVRSASYTYRKRESKHHFQSLEAINQDNFSVLEGIAAYKFDQPIQHTLWQESCRTLEEFINTLPMQYQEVILLRFRDELSLDEIATVLQRPLGTVKCYQYRGLRLLQQKAKQWELTREDLDVWSDYSRSESTLWNYVFQRQRIEPVA